LLHSNAGRSLKLFASIFVILFRFGNCPLPRWQAKTLKYSQLIRGPGRDDSNKTKINNVILKRTASAVCTGTLKDGKGELNTQSKTLNATPSTFKSRFEDGSETKPDELLAAAHAGCFAMALSKMLEEAGFPPDTLEV